MQLNRKDNFYPDDFILIAVNSDGNIWYRALALQSYANENYYNLIRNNAYNYLSKPKEEFKHFGQILNAFKNIDYIQNERFWMRQLEIQTLVKIYDLGLIAFHLYNGLELKLYNINSNINNNNKIILTLC